MKPIIVIQDDFSTTWNAVSSMKGMIKTIDPSIDIEDGTHDIEPFNIWMAAQELETVESCWPKGTIFVSVVDPGVGSKRRACAAKLKDGNIVITPDNGTLSLVAAHVGIEEVREIDGTVNRSHYHEMYPSLTDVICSPTVPENWLPDALTLLGLDRHMILLRL